MGKLRDRMEEDLILRGLSPATRRNYLLYCHKFAAHYHRSPEQLGEDEIRDYFLHLIQAEQIGYSTYRQNVAALKFLYRFTLKRPGEVNDIPFPRRSHVVLPEILGQDQLVKIFAAIRLPKYRALLMTCYSAGLRVGEACKLRAEDIDSNRMVIIVRCGKGNKQRYTLLSRHLLMTLREYWLSEHPKEWLFPNHYGSGHATTDAARSAFSHARVQAGLEAWCTPHTLRHCFATHLLESGTDLAIIQALLGHASIRTTTLYTHVRTDHIGKITSPLDFLPFPKGDDKRR